jgi:aspartyl/asparaginyl beta-hydroxylase (cupin superfamily)
MMITQPDAAALAAQAGEAARAGRFDAAEALWRRVAALDPGHVEAAFSLGVHALQRGAGLEALQRFEIARAGDPGRPVFAAMAAQAAAAAGHKDKAWEAVRAALALDPYYLPALLLAAEFHHAEGKPKAAAVVYGNALKIAPPAAHWPDGLRARLEQGRALLTEHQEAFADRLHGAVAQALENLPAGLRGRWREAIAIKAGQSKAFVSQANQLAVPRLPAEPFFDRAHFAWADALEARAADIRREMQDALDNAAGAFMPYIQLEAGRPIDQWAGLNHSKTWSTFQLWRNGAPVAENLARCPATAAALSAVDVAEIAGLCPNAMFSVLAPHTDIPPHSGETNARLVAHLPLIVPPQCRFRVGFEERSWREGELLVFDDTIEHAARNESDSSRVVLIFDVWNPHLSAAERAMTRALMQASYEFYADES